MEDTTCSNYRNVHSINDIRNDSLDRLIGSKMTACLFAFNYNSCGTKTLRNFR